MARFTLPRDLYPVSYTHLDVYKRQGLIRLSVGLEHIDDILDDLKKGFAAIR